MILKFNQFILEELRVSDLDDKTLEVLKGNLTNKLYDWRDSIIDNIKIENNKPVYIGFQFDKIDKGVMMRELENEFTKELVSDFRVAQLLNDIELEMDKKSPNVRRAIKSLFNEYILKLKTIV
jgi:hypothetical protein